MSKVVYTQPRRSLRRCVVCACAEVKKFLRERNLLKYFDFHTGMTRGDLDPKVVDTLLDLVDQNGDGSINYAEFSNVVMAGVH